MKRQNPVILHGIAEFARGPRKLDASRCPEPRCGAPGREIKFPAATVPRDWAPLKSWHRCVADGIKDSHKFRRCNIFYALAESENGWAHVFMAGNEYGSIMEGVDALENLHEKAEAWIANMPVYERVWEAGQRNLANRAKPYEIASAWACVNRVCPKHNMGVAAYVVGCLACGGQLLRRRPSELRAAPALDKPAKAAK